ncbi:MAG: branched-chain amino acid transaminase [Euryhalocaulis sp.]|uniref:branched-chain amino acid transaminase n=1 Tax=Euryhalocaulis sp. TaxID=2744307 RepID=UPI001841DA5B|nr:branched-chain amino acid transaminase [Euryhalocaulis sp.]MBA4802779.1 branched-chain amino acid transaminase [Euryhalocaulis sp.]
MPIAEADYIWMNGGLRPWAKAQTHVLSHGLHYGSSVFEGVRVYATPKGPQAFRLTDHIRRLYDSAKIYEIEIPFAFDGLMEGCRMVVRENGLESAYLRPIAYYGYGEIGVVPPDSAPVDVVIAGFPWGAYLGETARAEGVDVCVSSWRRPAPNTIPTAAKAGGNYLSSLLISREAKRRGFTEGIGLDHNGLISEGAGENLFLVKDGRLLTPPAASSILGGITRDTVMTLAREAGIEVAEQALPREMLYLADEAFFTGTAAEITPIRSVDQRMVGAGRRGPVTEQLQETFFGLFSGATPDRHGWLEPMAQPAEGVQADAKIAV